MLHIALAMTDKYGTYAKFAGTAILSILVNTKENVVIHLLHDDTLTNDNRKKLYAIVNEFNQTLKLYNVGRLQAERLSIGRDCIHGHKELRYTWGAMYRLLMADVLPADIDRIIYIDVDTICHLDIQELWNYPRKHIIAAAADEAIQMLGTPFDTESDRFADNYFNSGVLIINLSQLRQQEIALWDEGIKFLKKTGIIFMTDQDILNHFFKQDYDVLPARYNKIVKFELLHRCDENDDYLPAIYHFADHMLTFYWRHDKYSRLFWHYFMHTPFCDVDFMGRLFENMQLKYQNLSCMFVRLLAEKKRIFISREKDKKYISEILNRKEHEEFITVDAGSLEVDIDNCKGKLLMIFLSEYTLVKKMLSNYGFKENADFIDGRILIPPSPTMGNEFSVYLIEKRTFDYDILARS